MALVSRQEVPVDCPACGGVGLLSKQPCARCGELLWVRSAHWRANAAAPQVEVECGVLPGFHFCHTRTLDINAREVLYG